ncbi:MAG: sugar ABC transporter permease [Thermoflexales bacterium]|nr:sugar ABC transporter permease [Thermoflexales bacterium]MDW8351118.1 sugar ABC transporter permease [Anaerolineae bacterium]
MAQVLQTAGTVPQAARGGKWRALLKEMWKHRVDYLFISPFFIVFLVFGVYPTIWGLRLSLSRWPGGQKPMEWVGLNNYIGLLTSDPLLGKAFLNTMMLLGWILPTGLAFALIVAVMLNARRLRGRGIFRTLYFLPFVTSGVIVAIVFSQFLDKNYGWVNLLLGRIGIPPVPWLTEAIPAQISVTLLLHWMGSGTNILIFLGALQAIDREIYEAAEIDGAGPVQSFFRITVPMLRPVLLFMIITATIGLINLYAQVKLLTNGGPQNNTYTMFMRMMDLIAGNRFGEGAALGFIMGGVILVITFIQLRLLRSWWTVEGNLKS